MHLWDRLRERLPVAGVTALNDSVRRCIWAQLLERPQDVGVMRQLPGGHAG